MPSAAYSNYELIVELLDCTIGTDVAFRATQENFRTELRGCPRLPDGLRLLIGELFQQRVITTCTITYGNTLWLGLSPTFVSDHELPLNGALEKFKEIYKSLTEQPGALSQKNSDEQEFTKCGNGVLEGIAQVVGLAAKATITATAREKLQQ
ncbi:MAG TPA: hypothetical protein VFZ58_03885 [Candidatus Saccharimonadales bacterium]